MTIFSRILDHKYQITALLSFFSIAGTYFYLHKNSNQNQKRDRLNHTNKEKQNHQNNQKPQPTFDDGELLFQSKCASQQNHGSMEKWSSLYSEFYFDKNVQIRKVLDHLDAEGITVQTIFKYSPLIAVDEYRKFTCEIRRRRRLVRTFNEDQYIKLIMDYEQEVDQLLQRSRQDIVYECQIDGDEFSNMKVIFEATQDLGQLMREAKKSLKNNKLIQKRPIPRQVLIKIIHQQVSFIRSRLYQRMKNKLEKQLDLSQDQILRVIQALIQDIIYQKYGYQKQQIQDELIKQSTSSNKTNTSTTNTSFSKGQIKKEYKQLMKARSQLQSDVGNINLYSNESEEGEEEEDKEGQPLSQGMTRSGVGSVGVHQDQVEV